MSLCIISIGGGVHGNTFKKQKSCLCGRWSQNFTIFPQKIETFFQKLKFLSSPDPLLMGNCVQPTPLPFELWWVGVSCPGMVAIKFLFGNFGLVFHKWNENFLFIFRTPCFCFRFNLNWLKTCLFLQILFFFLQECVSTDPFEALPFFK